MSQAASPPPLPPQNTLEYAAPASQLNLADRFLTMCVCKSETPYYLSPEGHAAAQGSLTDGDLFSIGKTIKQRGVKRVEITLLDGTPAYLPAEAPVYRIRNAKLKANATMYAMASGASEKIDKLKTGADIVLVDEYKIGKIKFIEIRDTTGRTGYIDGATQMQIMGARAKSAVKEMLTGGAICLVGLVITIGTYALASSSPEGGTYFIMWGPVVFGGVQFFRGLSRLGEHVPPATLLERQIEQIVGEKIQRKLSGYSPIPLDKPVTPPDQLQAVHFVVSIIFPFIGFPWGIANLLRGRRRSGLAMVITSLIAAFIVGTLITVAVLANN